MTAKDFLIKLLEESTSRSLDNTEIYICDFKKININSLLGKEKEYIYYEKRFM